MKYNVLHLVGSFHQGGSERQAVQLIRLLHESSRYRVHVACLNRSGVLLGEVESLGVGEIPEWSLDSFHDRKAIVQLRRFAKSLREQEIDVVHTHDFYTNVFGIAAARMARVPVRIAARRETTGFRSKMQKTVERGAYRMAHAIIANAEAVKGQLIEEGVRAEKIVTIYNGLDMKRVTPQRSVERGGVLAKFNLPQGTNNRFVTIVANLRHPVKDHATFLRAAQRVIAKVPEASFVIAGEGELTDEMRALASELKTEGNVFFTGRCENVAELLFVTDVCVLSSKAEGFSNSILEYMGAARPVVATNVGGAREAVVEGETGYLVEAGDDETMAERIASLLLDSAKAQAMGERGQQIVREKFSSEAQLERTQNLYDQLLLGARRPLSQFMKRASHGNA
ncbi:MAG: glycosyltransferase [Pyrinomonadaceae bacterium]